VVLVHKLCCDDSVMMEDGGTEAQTATLKPAIADASVRRPTLQTPSCSLGDREEARKQASCAIELRPMLVTAASCLSVWHVSRASSLLTSDRSLGVAQGREKM
jgi:hypothetical protein